MTTIWERLDVETKVVEVLRSVPRADSPNLEGQPFLSAYQLAIVIDARYPEVRQALGDVPVGGADSGARTSLAQYLAQQLGLQIRRSRGRYPIEGTTLSRMHLGDMWFRVPGGQDIRNSNADAGYDLSLFRLRDDQP